MMPLTAAHAETEETEETEDTEDTSTSITEEVSAEAEISFFASSGEELIASGSVETVEGEIVSSSGSSESGEDENVSSGGSSESGEDGSGSSSGSSESSEDGSVSSSGSTESGEEESTEVEVSGTTLRINRIADCSYTGQRLTPAVELYDGSTLLKKGTDYKVTYVNNINVNQTDSDGGVAGSLTDTSNGFDPDLPYVRITGSGSYSGVLYVNFNILPAAIGDGEKIASGVTLNYTDQSTVQKKAFSPVKSLKYGKTLKEGTDYTVALEAADEGTAAPTEEQKIPAGSSGTWKLTITGTGNYNGTIVRTVCVADSAVLLKNATVTLGSNCRSVAATGSEIRLCSAWYDAQTKTYYTDYLDDELRAEAAAADVFTVKMGKTYLIEGKDFTVSYAQNSAVGTASLIITGMGDYVGSKTVSFKITGVALTAKSVRVEGLETKMTYTGEEILQDGVALYYGEEALVCGEDYSVEYQNNTATGTATMTFRALSGSKYTGSFKKMFCIEAAELTEDMVDPETLTAVYSASGAKPSLTLTYAGQTLTEGTDYTLACTNNRAVTDAAQVTVKGKGNFSGRFTLSYAVTGKSLANVTVTVVALAYKADRDDSYRYTPTVTVKDGSTKLRAGRNYTYSCENVTQAKIRTWQETYQAYLEGNASRAEVEAAAPKLTVTALGGDYTGSQTISLPVYQTKLTSSQLYIVVDGTQVLYGGDDQTPDVAVYYSTDQTAVKKAKQQKLTDEASITALGLAKFTEGEDYLTAFSSTTAGSRTAYVTVSGLAPLYSGSLKESYTISIRTLSSISGVHDHSYEEEVLTAVSCTADGEIRYTCACGESYTGTVAATGHSYIDYYTDEATCEAEGAVYMRCTACGEVSRTETIPATGHDYAATVDTAAGCTEAGRMKYRCENCGDIYYAAIPAAGHTYEAETLTEASCTEEGEIRYTCAACSDSYTVTVAKTEHNYVYSSHIDSSCTGAGADVYTCTVCGGEKQVASGSASGHTASDWIVDAEASCQAAGSRHRECTVCGVVLEEESIAQLEHEAGAWITDVEASCDTVGSAHRACTLCGETLETKELARSDHNYELTETVEATCVEQGMLVYTCSGCGGTKVEYTDTVEHTPSGEWIVYKAATETAEGIEVERCSVCRNILQQRTIEKLEHVHSYDTVLEQVEATCVTGGYIIRQCSCGLTQEEIFLPNGHTAGEEWETLVEATANNSGLDVQRCTECGAIVNQRVTIFGVIVHVHSYDDYESRLPFCTMDGYETYTCSGCGDSYTNILSAWGHTASDWITGTEATCTESGSAYTHCQTCWEILETKEIPATGHTAGEVAVETEATCTEDGLQVVRCETCGEILESETIPATGHSYGEWETAEDGASMTRTCANCSATETKEIAHEHSYVETGRAASTCTVAGYVEYTCSECGDTYTDALPLAEHTAGEWQTVTAATENATGLEARYCTVCGKTLETKVIEKLEHTHAYSQETTPATCTENGQTVYTCSCGDSYTVT
ncbi:MAG: hypothetical protein LIO67_09920, partial [Lachnospiraceae bacterium]|nr:hypothetical protein [Lachnospiraceae bacterium]